MKQKDLLHLTEYTIPEAAPPRQLLKVGAKIGLSVEYELPVKGKESKCKIKTTLLYTKL